MTEAILGFVIWILTGIFFIIMGIYEMLSRREKPFGFWSNSRQFPVEDARAYNRALGKMWCVFGLIFCLLGIPLLGGQNSPGILLSVIGVMAEVIGVMAYYIIVLEGKHRKK